jgi:Na+-transporting NADH:ubiquinone oxidoreductase subunit F
MSTATHTNIKQRDYSLVGTDTDLAIKQGLANAAWYTSPVPREKLRELLTRRDGPAIRDTLLWFALLIVFGRLGYLLWGSWWAVIPFVVYGILYASVSDSRWHESSHGTAFKTDWMNNALYELASFMVLRESVPWRWSHVRHHSDTLVVGRDPEIAAQRPTNIFKLILNFFNINALRMYVRNLALHISGRLNEEEQTYIPANEYGKVFTRARIHASIYAAVIALSIYTQSILPLMYIGLSSIYGAWLMVVYGYTQHAGLAENVLDHRLNCRTVYMNPIHRFLYWNMGYHVEHHMFPLVPYHALPKLHAIVKDDMPPPYPSIISAYREIIPAVIRQSKDPEYYVKRPLPIPASQPVEADNSHHIHSTDRFVDGWLEVCGSAVLANEDVLRFDHDQHTYAVYRAADGAFYATDGLCTHGNAHLADGMVKGTLIECAKHNGRFDIRDGSPQRQPVCVGLKTYPMREVQGKLLVDLSSAGGFGVTHAAPVHTFRVVSNQNVTPYIKELVLEPADGAELPAYQPGDYLQFDIPVYAERSLRDLDINPTCTAAWQAQGLLDLTASNSVPSRRSYSMVGSPTLDTNLRFNIRIAVPPPGMTVPAGTASTYLFSLKPGEIVTAIGPFGDFHVSETEREKVYLGGGSGMAPLRSHLSYLLETCMSTARISYWFGARTRQEVYYQAYFENLARKYPNFTFHVVLSEALPEDSWHSYTGFVHAALKSAYLDSHPDPKSVEYFLCGPPVMVKAATTMLREFGVSSDQVFYDEF